MNRLGNLRKGLTAASSIAAVPALLGLWGSSKQSRASTSAASGLWNWKVGAFCLSKDETTRQLAGQDLTKRLATINGNCCGEDAFSISQNALQMIIAIADGVGGWRKKGIDPSRFSRCLMEQVSKLVAADTPSHDDDVMEPKEILRRAFYGLVQKYLRREGEPPFGSSTACIVSLHKTNGVLDVANLGDSGAVLVREGTVVFRTEAQQTRFNAPYQATLRPTGDIDDMTPMADQRSFQAQAGDILVVGTDGLWDNLWERDLVDFVVERASKAEASTEAEASGLIGIIAKDLVLKARAASENAEDSPFAVEARKYGKFYSGGKPDDITAIISIITLDSTT